MKITKIISAVLAICLLFSFAACSKNYSDDKTSQELAELVKSSIVSDSGYRPADSDYLDFNISGASELCKDYVIIFSEKDTCIDEFGILRANNEKDAKALQDLCNEYLEKKNSAWNDDYLPEEAPKLRNARVFVFGSYAVYLILSDSNSTIAQNTIKDALTA